MLLYYNIKLASWFKRLPPYNVYLTIALEKLRPLEIVRGRFHCVYTFSTLGDSISELILFLLKFPWPTSGNGGCRKLFPFVLLELLEDWISGKLRLLMEPYHRKQIKIGFQLNFPNTRMLRWADQFISPSEDEKINERGNKFITGPSRSQTCGLSCASLDCRYDGKFST